MSQRATGSSLGLPSQARIREVGPRDGFQNEPEIIPTEQKARLIELLLDAGVPRIEVGSMVRPDVVPQLADSLEVLSRLAPDPEVGVSVLVPNVRGYERALEERSKFNEISVFLSASESHNQHNVNRSVRESVEGLREVLARARQDGLRRVAVIATSFGCPYEGEVSAERVLDLAEELAGLGCEEIGFGDTTGMANPLQVRRFFGLAGERLGGSDDAPELTAHFHNTRGQGLANVLAALDSGIESFESSFGELGGCPVPPGSTGNIASEDLVSMLHEMDIETGIDLPKLLIASEAVQEALGRPLGAHVLKAGPVEWGPPR